MKHKRYQFDTANETVQHAEAQGGEAISLNGKFFVATDPDFILYLQTVGADFAYLCDHAGQLVTVPAN